MRKLGQAGTRVHARWNVNAGVVRYAVNERAVPRNVVTEITNPSAKRVLSTRPDLEVSVLQTLGDESVCRSSSSRPDVTSNI